MPRNFRLRLSLYVTLALAALCLAAAEQPFFTWSFVCAAPLLALMLAAFLLEGRWALPIWAANVLGFVIAAAWGAWIDLRIFGDPDLGMEGVPLAAALLPDVGPLLAVLIVALLFRPRGPRDFWMLQALGLLEVALGSVLASGPLFGALLCAYLAAGLWSVALYNLCREPVAPGGRAVPLRTGVWRCLPAVLGVALALFLVLPRTASQPWDPVGLVRAEHSGSAATAETGAPEEMDLNRTGRVLVNDEVAVQVTATDAAGRPKLDLDPNQHWRCRFVDRYESGRWTGSYESSLAFQAQPAAPAPAPGGPDPLQALLISRQTLFDLGPRQYLLKFTLDPRKTGGYLLADPVVFRDPGGRVRGSCWRPNGGGAAAGFLFFEAEGSLVSSPALARELGRYEQVTVPPAEEGLGPPVAENMLHPGYRPFLCHQPAAGLTDWTLELVKGLAARRGGGLKPEDIALVPARGSLAEDHPDGVLPPEKWEKVARALCDYLAHSGAYTYSLERRRKDRDMDPTLDFLCNVKEGHCERYAGGLALMLRALGIPARVVIGYRGADSEGEGDYVVRQSQAHTWVECLVPRRAPDGSTQSHWLELDPNPEGEAPRPPLFDLAAWRDSLVAAGKEFWQRFILDYSPERQEDVWQGAGQAVARLRSALVWGGWAVAFAGVGLALSLAAAWLIRRARWQRRHRPAGGAAAAFYRRLLAILARRRRLRPRPTQTPREFAAAASSALAAGVRTAALAGVPGHLAELLYRVRFGGRPLTAEEERAVGRDLDRLDAALAGR